MRTGIRTWRLTRRDYEPSGIESLYPLTHRRCDNKQAFAGRSDVAPYPGVKNADEHGSAHGALPSVVFLSDAATPRRCPQQHCFIGTVAVNPVNCRR